MLLPPPLRSDLRLRGLLLMLLLALCLLAGVSFSQNLAADQHQVVFEQQPVPAVRLVRELALAVDDTRGLVALHLLLRSADARAEVEQRLQATRARIDRRMADSARALTDDTDRQFHAAVQRRLLAYWAAHDQLLVASRRLPAQAAAADAARGLMQGASQQAFDALRAELEAWAIHTEQAALVAAQQARAAAWQAWLLSFAGFTLALLALLALGGCSWPRRQHAVLDPAAGQAPPAEHPLLRLNAAVSAARQPVRGSSLVATPTDSGVDKTDAAAQAPQTSPKAPPPPAALARQAADGDTR